MFFRDVWVWVTAVIASVGGSIWHSHGPWGGTGERFRPREHRQRNHETTRQKHVKEKANFLRVQTSFHETKLLLFLSSQTLLLLVRHLLRT